MSKLPPFSTFATSKQMPYPQATSHNNILSFTPPGFNQVLNIKFPDSRLAVCSFCKKNYKTRDMCRVRNGHTAAPWTTAYICMTLDDSCTNEDGTFIDEPLTVRMVQWQPFCVTNGFDKTTPVCSACKKTNRTKTYCRVKHQHKYLPWSTVYVLLSALESTDPSTIVAAPSKPVSEEGAGEEDDKKPSVGDSEKKDQNSEEGGAEQWEGDDINAIPESRTFLATVSHKGKSIHWLTLNPDYDGPANGEASAAAFLQPLEAYHQAPYQMSASYAHQLKAQQQYFYRQQMAPSQQGWSGQYQSQAQYMSGQMPTAGEAAAQQQTHEVGQWQQQQQQGMPLPQMYQHTMAHFQQAGGALPPGMSSNLGGMDGSPGEGLVEGMDPSDVGADQEEEEEEEEQHSAKRARMDV